MAHELNSLAPALGTDRAPAGKLAAYWDFENVHASLGRQPGASGADARRVQIDAVVTFLKGLGDLLVHRAYGDWRSFSAYAPDLLRHALDLVQLFPRAGAKNGADIRLALDALEDLHHRPELTHLIVVGSDSDFVSLAQKARQAGKTVIGIGMAGSTSSHWMQACSQFVLYHELPGVMATSAAPAPQVLPSPWTAQAPRAGKRSKATQPQIAPVKDLAGARTLLRAAMLQLQRERGGRPIFNGDLKQRLLKSNPGFRERTYGFASFKSLMKACLDMFEVTPHLQGQATIELISFLEPEPCKPDPPVTSEVVIGDTPPHPRRSERANEFRRYGQRPSRGQLELDFNASGEAIPAPPNAGADTAPGANEMPI